MNKTQSLTKLQDKINAIERVIIRHSQDRFTIGNGSTWFDEMADMCTERKDLKKMLKKLLTAI